MINIVRKNREAKALKGNIKKRTKQYYMRKQSTYASSPNEESKISITGGKPLIGSIEISGAKNSALPLIFASLLASDIVTINNVPDLSDIHVAINILKSLGVKVSYSNNSVVINPTTLCNFCVDEKLISSMRASVLMLGPILAKYKLVETVSPGGCTIGARPIDIHLSCLTQLGAIIHDDHHCIKLTTPEEGLKGTTINMQKASVGATENLLMTAVLAKGTTKIINPAKEPEIIDLINMLNSMGAKISGAGTGLITIEGVSKLHGTTYSVCPDRIEAGSYLMVAAITKGELTLNNVCIPDLENIIKPLKQIGCYIEEINDTSIKISCKNIETTALDITTGPYPDFSTDLQPQWVTLMCLSKGSCKVTETIFENRFTHVQDLQKMGANITIIDNNSCQINGVLFLQGASVNPSDLRASFALVMAGLAANGTTIIENLNYLNRGYENLVLKLKKCGANIAKISSL